MAKKTPLQEVKDKMQELQTKKAEELAAVKEKQAATQNELAEAQERMKDATAVMNLDAYEEARAAKQKASTALEMYRGKYEQIKNQEYISEQDSDQIIDGLLEYEKELAEDFKATIAPHIKALDEALIAYRAEVHDTEATILAWQNDIHANYSTRGKTYRTDPFTGQKTDRSETPTPVRLVPYTGCTEAAVLDEYLKKAAHLYIE